MSLAEIKGNQLLEIVAQRANQLGLENQRLDRLKVSSDFMSGIVVTLFTHDHIRIQ